MNDDVDPRVRLAFVAGEARAFFDLLHGRAEKGLEARRADRNRLKDLSRSLLENAGAAARVETTEKIERLSEVIRAHDATLSLPDLPEAVRRAVKADRSRRVARRGRLRTSLGNDFAGILTVAEVEALTILVAEVDRLTNERQQAAELLSLALRLVDRALATAARFPLS